MEAAGASAYGVASAMLQVTRTLGMSVGLALLTSIGQNRIGTLARQVHIDHSDIEGTLAAGLERIR